jgi:trk system potassium uptake protein TrkA
MHIAKSLAEYGSEVTGIDIDAVKLSLASGFLKKQIRGDVTDTDFLESLNLKEMDGVLISAGTDLGLNILVTLSLKKLGIEKIIVCAYSENHYKIIEQIGVKDIVFPQRDIAAWLGKKLSMKNVLDYIPLAGEYVVMNVRSPKSFVGVSIRDLQIGARFQCQILGIKYIEGNESWNPDKPEWENMKIAPTANEIIPADSVLLFLGKRSDLKKIQEMD